LREYLIFMTQTLSCTLYALGSVGWLSLGFI
jgi:hypothetical protein